MGLTTTQSNITSQNRDAEASSAQLTNWREAAGYFLARAITAAVLYFLGSTVLLPFYTSLSHVGGVALMVGTASVSALMWLATLLLFLLFRGLFGGVPPIVARQGRGHAFTLSGREALAYIVASLFVLVIFVVFNDRAMLGVYSSLRINGRTDLVPPVTRLLLAATAVTFFLIFLALRRAILKAAEIAKSADQRGGSRNVGFGQAIAICFGKYAEFGGRAGRPEYWFWVLFQALLVLVLTIVDLFSFGVPNGLFSALAALTLLLPGAAVTIRRLHDIDYSGWWLLILLVPAIGLITLIVMTCLRGTEASNRFGPALTA